MNREEETTQPGGRTPEQDFLWKIVGLCRKAWKKEIDFYDVHHPVEAGYDKAISAEEEIHKLAIEYATHKATEAIKRVKLKEKEDYEIGCDYVGYNIAIDDLEAVKQKVIEEL